jgi:hypothetical protein
MKGGGMANDEKVRLTVEIPKALWRRAKQRALDTDRDLRQVVIEALEGALGAETKKGGKR